MLKNLVGIFFIGLLFGCASTKNATTEEIAKFKSLVENNNITFTARSANPLGLANVRGIQNLLPPGSNIGRIDLLNISNYLTVKNDSIQMDMPYYGEQQLPSGYNNTNINMTFEGIPKEERKAYNDKKQEYTFRYNLKTDKENLQVYLILFPNQKASLRVNSSHRTSIAYRGQWEILE